MLLDLALLTLRSPRQGLRAVLGLGLPMGARVAALVLMAVASALLLHASLRVSPLPATHPVVMFLAASPFQSAAMQAAILFLMAGLLHRLGRAWGGAGSFDEAVLTAAWFQAFFVVLQGAQLLALLVLPPLSDILGLVSVVLFFWLLTQFAMELHGFRSPWPVFFTILAVLVALSFLMSFLLLILLGPEVIANV